eukprot:TRINITY_DN305_c3_g1_i1.p2 TRINITY_DN305_c3_g1~~TRINITY_DN305_c3_g1_i1.p2  ORF type:complete len:203 (-),score=-34.98 TRINITY_DN305_c3_g1_i1:106-714(-)
MLKYILGCIIYNIRKIYYTYNNFQYIQYIQIIQHIQIILTYTPFLMNYVEIYTRLYNIQYTQNLLYVQQFSIYTIYINYITYINYIDLYPIFNELCSNIYSDVQYIIYVQVIVCVTTMYYLKIQFLYRFYIIVIIIIQHQLLIILEKLLRKQYNILWQPQKNPQIPKMYFMYGFRKLQRKYIFLQIFNYGFKQFDYIEHVFQ